MNRVLITRIFTISFIILILAIFVACRAFTAFAFTKNRLNYQYTSVLETQGIELGIKDIVVSKVAQNTVSVKIIFGAHNPQTSTILLDGIHYNIFTNNHTVSSGDIGSEALIDVMRSEPEFPIISNDTIFLKDINTVHTNASKDDIYSAITAGNPCFTVNGTYFYRQAAGLAASGGANDFHTAFPINCKLA